MIEDLELPEPPPSKVDGKPFELPRRVTFEPPHSNTLRQCLLYGILRADELGRTVEVYPVGAAGSGFLCRPGDSVSDILDSESSMLSP